MDTEAIVRGFLTAGLWADAHDDSEEPYEDALEHYGVEDFTPESIAKATEVCEGFAKANADDLDNYRYMRDYDAAQGSIEDYIGHDIWLTANHHGAGFWDRGLGEVGERLTASAHTLGAFYVYVDRANQVCHLEEG